MLVNEKTLEAKDLRLMQYKGSNVIGTVNQVYAFCCDGIEARRDKDKLQNILNDLWLGKLVVAEDSRGIMVDTAETWEEWSRR